MRAKCSAQKTPELPSFKLQTSTVLVAGHAIDFYKLVQKYPGLRIAHRNFPLYNLAGHETSLQAAMASEYAASQGKFWDFYQAAFSSTNANRIKSVDGLYGIVRELDIDMDDFAAKMDAAKDETLVNKVNDDFTFATHTLKIDTTPISRSLSVGMFLDPSHTKSLNRISKPHPQRSFESGR
ncbi:MAG: thioredoxin domain-containing protein [Fimbriimonadaceae bacterium]